MPMSHLKTTSHFGMKGRFCLAMLWIDILEWVWEMLLGKAYSSFTLVEIYILQISCMEKKEF